MIKQNDQTIKIKLYTIIESNIVTLVPLKGYCSLQNLIWISQALDIQQEIVTTIKTKYIIIHWYNFYILWNVLNEGNDGVSYITADATPYVPCALFDSHSRAWHSLLLITQVSMISIFVTQFSIWYRSVFFQVKRKALRRKTQSKSIFSWLSCIY